MLNTSSRDVLTKCDKKLAWWLRLVNLHRTHQPACSSGFTDKVRLLGGPTPAPVETLLNPDCWLDLLIAAGSDPDQCLWELAGVADSVLSKIVESHAAGKLPKEILVADWSKFAAPLLLRVSAAGQIERADHLNPLDDLLALLRGESAASLGICPVCAKLFERLRRDQKCDIKRCRDTYRQRLFRQRHEHKGRHFALSRMAVARNKRYPLLEPGLSRTAAVRLNSRRARG
jgi:hypothetical protein